MGLDDLIFLIFLCGSLSLSLIWYRQLLVKERTFQDDLLAVLREMKEKA